MSEVANISTWCLMAALVSHSYASDIERREVMRATVEAGEVMSLLHPYTALLRNASPGDLAMYALDQDSSIAMQAKWMPVLLQGKVDMLQAGSTMSEVPFNPVLLGEFLGFVEGRSRIRISGRWKKCINAGMFTDEGTVGFPVCEHSPYLGHNTQICLEKSDSPKDAEQGQSALYHPEHVSSVLTPTIIRVTGFRHEVSFSRNDNEREGREGAWLWTAVNMIEDESRGKIVVVLHDDASQMLVLSFDDRRLNQPEWRRSLNIWPGGGRSGIDCLWVEIQSTESGYAVLYAFSMGMGVVCLASDGATESWFDTNFLMMHEFSPHP